LEIFLWKIEDVFLQNGDGTVSREEFQEMCNNLSPEEVKAAFQRFDRNGDDRLNYREFCHMIHMRWQKI